MATRRKPVLYASIHRNEAPDADVARSFIAVPLVIGETCLGVLNLGHGKDGHYGPAGLRAAEIAITPTRLTRMPMAAVSETVSPRKMTAKIAACTVSVFE